MNLNYKIVEYEDKKYAIISILYKNTSYPVLLDYKDLNIIKKIKKKWKSNLYGFVYCYNTL